MRPVISVALAACNGAPYLRAQVESVLPQLTDADELVLSVNPSTDGTEELAAALAAGDSRVRLTQCDQPGVIPNFSHALSLCRGEIVFLCDQDDLWLPGKVERVLSVFEDEAVMAVVHGCLPVDGANLPLSDQPWLPRGELTAASILWKNQARGCCMALRARVLEAALPLPPDIPMHDSYLALTASRLGKVRCLPQPLIRYRRHTGNASPARHQSLAKMLRDRLALLRHLRR